MTRHVTSTLLACLLLAAGASGQFNWFVDDLACETTHTADLQEAIDAAADGDTIFVRSTAGFGHPEVLIQGKSLTLIGVGTPRLGKTFDNKRIRIVDLAAHQSVLLRGFECIDPLRVRDCQGPVWIEDCSFLGNDTTVNPTRPGAEIERSAAVTLVDCVLVGSDAPPQSGSNQHDNGPGLLSIDSRVHVYDSELVGGSGGIAQVLFVSGADGGHGAHVVGTGFLLLDGCTVTAGDGGINPTQCDKQGAPGSGLFVDTLDAPVWHVDSTFSGGLGGQGLLCPPAVQGPDLGGVGLVHTHALAGSSRGLRSELLVAAGETTTLSLDVQPGDQAWLALHTVHAPLALPGFEGATLPLLGGLLLSLGAPGGPVQIDVSVAAGSLPQDLSVPLYMQVLVTNAGDKRAGSGSALSVLEEGVAAALDCSFLPIVRWVDDDAPGDPAPGDPLVGDPAANGSPEHPHDDIQEALDAAHAGDVIVVRAGSYPADLQWPDIPLTVESESGAQATVLAGGPGLVFSGEPAGFALRGFTLAGAGGSGLTVHDTAALLEQLVVQGSVGAGLDLRGAGATIRDLALLDNTAPGLNVGAGVSAQLQRLTILRNSTHGLGGGVRLEPGSALELSDSIVGGNTALLGSGVLADDASLVLRHCTVAHNPGSAGSELYLRGTSSAVVEHCIVWGGSLSAWVEAGASLAVDFSDVRDGPAGIGAAPGSTVTWGSGNLSAGPNFVDVPGLDLHLKASSPCIDAGDPGFTPAPGQLDVDGEPRVQGAAVDLGADEF